MHSRIFRIINAKSEKPTKTIEEELNMWDNLPSGMDYVIDQSQEELKQDIQWLFRVLDMDSNNPNYYTYNSKTKTIVFGKWFKREYFDKRLDELKEKLSQDDAEKRFSESGMFAYELCSLIEEKYGFQVMSEDGCITNFDDFVRCLKIDTEYKILQSADYHW